MQNSNYNSHQVVSTLLQLFLALSLVLVLPACTTISHPKDRAILARPNMSPESRSLPDSTDDHIYFSKEASSGGRGGSGGGCGCN